MFYLCCDFLRLNQSLYHYLGWKETYPLDQEKTFPSPGELFDSPIYDGNMIDCNALTPVFLSGWEE
jgi:hypothetical protein